MENKNRVRDQGPRVAVKSEPPLPSTSEKLHAVNNKSWGRTNSLTQQEENRTVFLVNKFLKVGIFFLWRGELSWLNRILGG